MRTLLQPIVRLHDRTIVGYEALSRGPQGSVLEAPDRLFAAASACGRTLDMELHSATLALQRTQVEDLIKNLSTSRDENLLADLEASLRVATAVSAAPASVPSTTAGPKLNALPTATCR